MKKLIALASIAVLAFASVGAATATEPPAKAPLVDESFSLPVSHDELLVEGFAAYNFNGSTDPWGYGVGATFFPNAGNFGITADYMLSPEGSPANFHTVNLGLTYRLHITDNIDIYTSGIVGYAVNEIDGLNTLANLNQLDYGNDVSYGGRAGLRLNCPNTNLSAFADYGRTWGGFSSNAVRIGLGARF